MDLKSEVTTIFYSTHILEDVQRVSDTVVILNHGQMVAEAPIQELLAGKGSSAMYLVALKGDAARAQTFKADFSGKIDGSA